MRLVLISLWCSLLSVPALGVTSATYLRDAERLDGFVSSAAARAQADVAVRRIEGLSARQEPGVVMERVAKTPGAASLKSDK